MNKYVVIIWWRGRSAPTVSPLITEYDAFELATFANQLHSVADARAATWTDACAILEFEERDHAS